MVHSMPTRDDLTNIDIEIVKSVLMDMISRANSKLELIFTVIQLYELSVVILSKKLGLTYVSTRDISKLIPNLSTLAQTRNICSHSMYDKNKVEYAIQILVKTTLIDDIINECEIPAIYAYQLTNMLETTFYKRKQVQ